ncbi:MAG TPA: M14 family zinc carboxypeptidase [Thermoanaerobaculia bacterium]|jgi:hypothetical protein
MKKLLFALCLIAPLARAADDAEYTKQIKRFTTGPQFTTELVDHLPASDKVPSPLQFFGHIAGADGFLTYSEDVNRYMRALEAASPRVKVVSIGKSEEGREMIAVAVADEATIASIDTYRENTRRLADPRKLSDDDARALIAQSKPIYYATGAIHSPETGSPEMLMELAYRLAVEETPFIRNIREHVITLITPVIEVDGRDRQVDLWNYRKANPNLPTPPLIYWGHYVAHDNNRDYLGLALALSRNVLKAYFDFHPQLIHDLHESVPFLYISTGTGPYNPALDPIVVDEWQRLAWNEVQQMTGRGVPGVWTWGFYDGWAPNYMIWTGQGHNSIGRFYETFGNRWPITVERTVRGQSERQWYRPNPPLPKVQWSLRDNVNYQQSALLFGLSYVADNRQHFLEQFWTLGKRAVAKAATEGPAAWAFDGAQKQKSNLRDLMALLQKHGVEVHQLDAPFEKLPAGSFVVRMDQPYSRLADAVLDTQYVRGEERVYDDTGWTLGYLKNVDFKRVTDPAILKAPMHLWEADAPHPAPAGATLSPLAGRGTGAQRQGEGSQLPYPRIAVMHTWLRTQDEGWWRIAFDSMHVPYTYISTQDAVRTPNLRETFDVIVFPPAGSAPADIVNGLPPGPPLPWKKTALTPNLGGIDETDDMRPGLGMTGVANIQRFVEDGGLLITARDTSVWAVQYGLARWVRTIEPRNLKARGSILQANVVEKKSPIVGTYDDNIPVYFAGTPIFDVGIRFGGGDEPPPGGEQRPSGRGTKSDPDVPQGRPFVPTPERPKPEPFALPEDAPWNVDYAMPRAEDQPRVIVAFAKKADQLLLSGMLEGGDELAGKAVVIDSPRGKGHILLFANNPMWRANTQGTYALVMNAIMNWNKLR